MSECTLRQPGEEFCADCPLRPVRDKCARAGYCQREQASIPVSVQMRAVVFLLSALTLMVCPVVLRAMYKIADENRFPEAILPILLIVFGIISAVTVVSALFGLYLSIWRRQLVK